MPDEKSSIMTLCVRGLVLAGFSDSVPRGAQRPRGACWLYVADTPGCIETARDFAEKALRPLVYLLDPQPATFSLLPAL